MHSINFDDRNTWDDWHLIPSTRPVIAPPQPKVNFIDIPGADGSLDLTEALGRHPNYANRSGSLEFIVGHTGVIDGGYDHTDKQMWAMTYTRITEYIAGRRIKMVLEDDPEYYYIGRFAVNNWKSDKNWSTITIDYNVEPFKYSIWNSYGEAEYNPFAVDYYGNLILKDIVVNSAIRKFRLEKDVIGVKAVVPTVTVESNAGIILRMTNPERSSNQIQYVFQNGTHVNRDFVFSAYTPGNAVIIEAEGLGKISLLFRAGRL